MAARDPLDPAAARHQLTEAARARREVAEAILDHRFGNPELVEEALTHRSAAPYRGRKRKPGEPGPKTNERLEFIGDRVLGLLVAEWLIERFPDEQEGELGRRHAYLVSRPVLARVAESAGLSQALAVGANEMRAGVGRLATVLADAMEALLGALYQDAGLHAARRFVRGAWQADLESMAEPPKDPKTTLQEWCMARGLPLPVYAVAERTGPSHAPRFVMRVSGAGKEGRGTAGSKRVAERDAAADLLAQLQA